MPDDLTVFGNAGPDRRAFLKRLIIGTAFAVPIVSSFTMSGMQSVFADTPRSTTLVSNSNTTNTASTPPQVKLPGVPETPTQTPAPAPVAAAAAAVEVKPSFTG